MFHKLTFNAANGMRFDLVYGVQGLWQIDSSGTQEPSGRMYLPNGLSTADAIAYMLTLCSVNDPEAFSRVRLVQP